MFNKDKKRISYIFRICPIAIVAIDLKGHVLIMNKEMIRFFGYGEDELLGQSIEILLPEDARNAHIHHRSEYFRNPKPRKMGKEQVLFGQHKNGNVFPVEVGLSFIKIETASIAIAYIIDITDRIQINDLLRSSLEKEMELNRVKSNLISTASHEFRTPLTVIQLSISLLRQPKLDEDKQIGYLDKIEKYIDYMVDLLDKMLVMSKLENESFQLNLTEFDLNKLCEMIVEEHQTLTIKGHNLIYIREGINSNIVADKILMQQIIANLLSNAIKYSFHNSNIDINLTCTQSEIILDVTNQGIPVSEIDKKYLFEPFYRSVNVSTIPGTGMGLSIVKYATELHGGSIRVKSETENSITFTVIIPRFQKKI